jgi:hypothetical protein
MVDEKVMRRIQGVLELSRRGVDGEKTSAIHHLEILLKKHNLTMADIESPDLAVKRYPFKYKNDLECRLLLQISVKITNLSRPPLFVRKGSRQELNFDLTIAQHAEFVMTYAILRVALANEVKILFSAFACTNRLFPETGNILKLGESPPLTAEQKRVLDMARMMSKTPILKALDNAPSPA